MKRTKTILSVILSGCIAIQFIQPARNKGGLASTTDFTKIYKVPKNIQAVFQSACYDCHSNNSNYPWYSNIQPAGWLLARHIKNGKAELNFNEFGSYSLRRQISKLNGIEHSIDDGTMPLSTYTWMHKSARLTRDDKTLLINWASGTRDSLSRKN